MTTRRPFRSTLLAALVLAGFLAGPQVVRADGVDQAQQQVDKMLSELDNLQNQMGQLDEDYSGALDRQTELQGQIAEAQSKVDRMSADLGGVEDMLQQIAVNRLTSGGSGELSPIFSTAARYTDAQQRDALGRLALDAGATNLDDLQAKLDDLQAAREDLARKQAEADAIVKTLADKQTQYQQLEQVYQQKYDDAKAKLGAAKLQAEEERRAAQASAAAAAAAARRPAAGNTGNTGGATTGSPGRGGGGTTGGNNGGTGGGGNSSAATSSPSSVVIPPVSGRAGIAVAAAQSQLGVPYRFAAESPGVAFDCSGLTKWAWGQAGVYLPHQSAAQYASIAHIPKDQAQPGDLIFYYSPIGHVGIYIGGGMLIHAPQTGDVVKIAPVHWNKVVGVGRPG